MEPEGSSPYSQEPATYLYPEPDRSSPGLLVIFRNMINFLRWGVVRPSPNPQAGGPSLVGCPRLQPEDAPCRDDRDPLITEIRVFVFFDKSYHLASKFTIYVHTSNFVNYITVISWLGRCVIILVDAYWRFGGTYSVLNYVCLVHRWRLRRAALYFTLKGPLHVAHVARRTVGMWPRDGERVILDV